MTKRKALRTLDPNLLPAKAKAPDTIDNDDYQPCSDGDSDYISAAIGRKRSARLAREATVRNENTPSQASQPVPAAPNADEIQPSGPTKPRHGRTPSFHCTLAFFADALGPSVEYPDLPEEESLEVDDPTLLIFLDDAVQSIVDTTNTPAEDGWWPSTDPTIDQKWDQFISDQVNMFGEQPQDYVKPSGTLSSNLLIQWHYPTYTTTCTGFGIDADISNPCIRMMFKKYRLDSDFDKDILVMERIWKRFDFNSRSHRNVAPYDDKPEAWRDQHTSFSDWLWTESQAKVVLLIGARNVQSFQARHPNIPSIKINETKCFGRNAWVWVMMKDGRVVRFVIPSYHMEAVLRGITSARAQLMDLVWNLAAAMVKRMVVNSGYFRWFGTMDSRTPIDLYCPVWDGLEGDLVRLAINVRTYEIRHNVQLRQEAPPVPVHRYIQRENIQPSPSEGSIMSQVSRSFSFKSRSTQAANGYPSLVKGRATQAAAEYPNLAKDLATMAAAGYPNLVKARAISAALGHPNLVKGHATRAVARQLNLVKGHAAQVVAGYSNLVKGLAT